jgi:hypothetical protein
MKSFFQALVILGLGLGAVIGTAFLSNTFKEPAVVNLPETIIITPPDCKSSVVEYKELSKKQSLVLLKNQISYATNSEFVKSYDVSVERSGTGEIACGYLYVKTKTNQGMLHEWENVYIQPQQLGGHLLRSKSIVENLSEKSTESLFALDSITYRPSVGSKKALIANWAKLLNVANIIKFDIALNTTNPTGTIEEIKIAYKCWNPNTGRETQDCNLNIVE